ncbi:MAG: hypothetical protein JST01_16565 [Cyanobacteria bacterium SZAS TMP-1]|nr:hypothetical protein [Cyanobacteria bacterium SZAS TMP-1]
MLKTPLLPTLAALAGALLLPLICALAAAYSGSFIPVGTCRELNAPNEICLLLHKPLPAQVATEVARADARPTKETRFAVTGPITTMQNNGTVRVNNLACLEALASILGQGLSWVLIAGGGIALARVWNNHHSLTHHSLRFPAAALALGLTVPSLISPIFEWMRQASLFN